MSCWARCFERDIVCVQFACSSGCRCVCDGSGSDCDCMGTYFLAGAGVGGNSLLFRSLNLSPRCTSLLAGLKPVASIP